MRIRSHSRRMLLLLSMRTRCRRRWTRRQQHRRRPALPSPPPRPPSVRTARASSTRCSSRIDTSAAAWVRHKAASGEAHAVRRAGWLQRQGEWADPIGFVSLTAPLHSFASLAIRSRCMFLPVCSCCARRSICSCCCRRCHSAAHSKADAIHRQRQSFGQQGKEALSQRRPDCRPAVSRSRCSLTCFARPA